MSDFGRYKRLRLIGSGGFGAVYRAYAQARNEDVALKLVPVGLDAESQLKVDAERYGAKLQERLRSDPHIPKVREFGTREWEVAEGGDGRTYFYVSMEYVDGRDLSDEIGHPMSDLKIVKIAIALCSTLEKAHSLTAVIEHNNLGQEIDKVVHGDLKPDNIRLDAQDNVKLLDFGIARALSSTGIFGTPAYCSRERLKNFRIDVHSDLWSIGVLLYQMVAKTLPFEITNQDEFVRFRDGSEGPPSLPNACPDKLRRIIERALDPDAAGRYQSAREMKAALEDLLNDLLQKETEPLSSAPGPLPTPNPVPEPQPEPIPNPAPYPSPDPTPRPMPDPVPSPPQRPAMVFAVVKRLLTRIPRKARLGGLVVVLLWLGYELIIWRNVVQLSGELISPTVLTPADLERSLDRYQQLSSRGWIHVGLPNTQDQLTSLLASSAELVINDYHNGVLPPKDEDKPWGRAKRFFDWILSVDSLRADQRTKSRATYCQGHIERVRSNYTEAIRHFDEAVNAHPQWADPHLGLAVVYAYGQVDPRRAAEELDTASKLGLSLGARATAIRADALRKHADRLRANKLGGTQRQENCRQAMIEYQQALDLYGRIPTFSDDARAYLKSIPQNIRDMRDMDECQRTFEPKQ